MERVTAVSTYMDTVVTNAAIMENAYGALQPNMNKIKQVTKLQDKMYDIQDQLNDYTEDLGYADDVADEDPEFLAMLGEQPVYQPPVQQYVQPQGYRQPQYANQQPQYAQPQQYVQPPPQYVQPQYVQPQYTQPQYAQPQYTQPQYAPPQQRQPQYAQPH